MDSSIHGIDCYQTIKHFASNAGPEYVQAAVDPAVLTLHMLVVCMRCSLAQRSTHIFSPVTDHWCDTCALHGALECNCARLQSSVVDKP
jgi:hypothetical protein